MTNDTQSPLWERLPTDTKNSYEAFCVYRDMGHERSLRAVSQKLGKNLTTIGQWSSRHDWVNRCLAYDDYLEQKHRARLERARIEVADNVLNDYREIRKAIKKRLDIMQAMEYTGKPGEIHEILNLMQHTDDYVRRTIGLPERITQSSNTNDNRHSGQVTLLSELSDDDLDSILDD